MSRKPKYPIQDLKIKDSILLSYSIKVSPVDFIARPDLVGMRNAISMYASRTGKKFETKQEPAGLRVTRIL